MCGRFTREFTWEEVNGFLSVLSAPRNLQPRYNIAPTDTIDVVRLDANGRRELVPMRWGLVPFFHKGTLKEFRAATFNARVETIDAAPTFRPAFNKGRRCIIPISGFYEWTGDKKDRQPHYFTAADGAPVMALAGLWERWNDPDTLEEMLSATIIVGAASKWMRKYHDRMPMMLDPKDFDGWLEGSSGLEVLKPAPEEALRQWPVSKRVNKSGFGDDDPGIIKPEPDDLFQ
jgi:putative SOS response-associated peptidase YedK